MSFYQYGGDTSADNHSALEEQLDVVVVGAGAAGVGCGVILQQLGITKLKIVERYEVGASFARWPEEMRFITPSFTSNGFGLLDLNAITLQTSPAYSLKTEHPGGAAYARYLQAVAKYHQLPISTGVNVSLVRPDPHSEGFLIETSQGMLSSRFVIWAAGEFQYPRTQSIAGAELCIHTSDIRSWRDVEGEAFLIIGGYESGIDAAVHLVTLGKKVLVVEDAQTWFSEESDPSLALSPYTHERLRDALQSGLLELVDHKRILRIERTSTGYVAEAESGEMYLTPTAPILATGFVGSLQCIANRFEWNEKKQAILTAEDESTIAPGLFVVGPSVRHNELIFCFIYKFRQRFAVVANAIAQRLGLDTTPLDVYRANGMFLDDLTCCSDECDC